MNWAGAQRAEDTGTVKAATNWLTDLSTGSLPSGIDNIGPVVYDPRPEYKGRLWAMGLDVATRTNKYTHILYSDNHGDTWIDPYGDLFPYQSLIAKLNMTTDGIFIWSEWTSIYRTSDLGVTTNEGQFTPTEYQVSNGGAGFQYQWQWGEFTDGTCITGAYSLAANSSIEDGGTPLSGLDLWLSTDGAAANTWSIISDVFDTQYPPVTGPVQHWHGVAVDPYTDVAWATAGDVGYNSMLISSDKFTTIEKVYTDNVNFVGLGFNSRAVWAGDDNPGNQNYIRYVDKQNDTGFQQGAKLPDDIEKQTIWYLECCGADELWALTWHHNQGGYSTLLKYDVNGITLTLNKRFAPITDNVTLDMRGISDMNGVIPEWSPFVYINVWDTVNGNTETCYRIARL